MMVDTINAPAGVPSAKWGFPATVRPQGARYDITEFAGADAVLNQPLDSQDWTQVINAAVSTGAPIYMGDQGAPLTINFTNTPFSSDGKNIVSIDADVPVDIECHQKTTFVAPSVLSGNKGMFYFKSASQPTSYRVNAPKFSWRNGIFSARARTAALAANAVLSGSGPGFLSLAWYLSYLVEGVTFDGGYRNHFVGSDGKDTVGYGYMDTLFGFSACGGGITRNCQFIGAYDEGTYFSGLMRHLSVGANPISFPGGGNKTATVTCSVPHGLQIGDLVDIEGATAVGGVTLSGGYLVTGVSGNGSQFQVEAATGPSSAASGGGTAVYISGTYADSLNATTKIVPVGANPISFTAANNVATVTTSGAHGLNVGDVACINQASAVAGVTLLNRYVIRSVPSANTFTVMTASNAAGAGSGGGASVILTAETPDYAGATVQATGDRILNCFYSHCGNAATYKRNGQFFDFTGNVVRECGGGLLAGTVDFTSSGPTDAMSAGKRFRVTNNDFLKIQGSPVVVNGRDVIVADNRIKDYGRTLASFGARYTPGQVGNQIAGIRLVAATGGKVHDNVIAQETPLWSAGTPPTNRETVGVFVRADDVLGIGSTDNQIHHNTVAKIDRAFLEYEGNADNMFDTNNVSGTKLPSVYSGDGTLLTEPGTRTYNLAIAYAGGGSVTAYEAASTCTGVIENSYLIFEAYIGIAAVSTSPAPSGQVTITGLPANASTAPITLSIDRAGSSGSGSLQAIMQANGSVVQLLLENGGAVSTFTAGGAGMGARFYVRGRIPINP